MKKVLFIGDPHITATHHSLEEGRKLIEFATKIAEDQDVDKIVILGDLHHTHSVVRVEVLNFWLGVFIGYSLKRDCILLVGNHDVNNHKESEDTRLHSLEPYSILPGVTVVERPTIIEGVGFMPYIHDPQRFLEAAKAFNTEGVETIVCHNTFIGALYENNFPAPDGIDIDSVPQKQIISGHIHMQQQVGKVWYPGSPMWMTLGDANQEKGICVVSFSKTNEITKKEFFSTKDVCRPIYSFEVREDSDELELPGNSRNLVTLIGSKEWINKTKSKYTDKAEIRTKIIEDRTENRIRESEGIRNSIQRYLSENFKIEGNTPKDLILKEILSRIGANV